MPEPGWTLANLLRMAQPAPSGPVERPYVPNDRSGWRQTLIDVLEGGFDATLGALGLPGIPDTRARQWGELLGAAVPVAGGLKALKATKGIKAYHGSPHDFDQFDITKAGSTTDRGLLGRALYFSTDENVAATRPHRYEVELDIQNPLEIAMPSWGGNKTKILNEKLGISPDATAEQITDAVRTKGHDSVALDYSPLGYDKKEYAVFDDKLISIVKKYGIAGAISAGLINEAQARALQQEGYQ